MGARGLVARGIATSVVCGLAIVGSLGSQPSRDSLRVGATVRVIDTMSRTTALAGAFAHWQGDTIVVVRSDGATSSLRMLESHRVDVKVAGPFHIVRNGFIGAVTGAVVLGTVGALIVDPEPSQSDTCVPLGPDGSCWRLTVGGTPRYMGAAVGAAYGAVSGGLIGGITGVFRHAQWKPVARGVRITVNPLAVRPAMTIRIPMGRSSR